MIWAVVVTGLLLAGHLVPERPTEAASILATLCRRKDKALRAMNDAHSAGKDFGDAYRIALSIAFPKSKPATATA